MFVLPPLLDLNALKKEHNRTCRLGILILLPWFSLSLIAIFLGTDTAFSRLGSLGVASALLVFSVLATARQRYVNGVKRFETLLIKSYLFLAFKRAEMGRLTEEQLGKFKPPLPPGFAPEDEIPGNGFETLARSIDRMIENSSEELKQWNEKSERWGRLEVFAACFASLQWGYGDLFHCWIKGNGWNIC